MIGEFVFLGQYNNAIGANLTHLIRICVKFAVVIGIYVLFQKYKEAGTVCQIATHDCTLISENDGTSLTKSPENRSYKIIYTLPIPPAFESLKSSKSL